MKKRRKLSSNDIADITIFVDGRGAHRFLLTEITIDNLLEALEKYQVKAPPDPKSARYVSVIPSMNRIAAESGYSACKLAAERFKSGMSQTFLGKATGIRPEHISAMEAGKRPIGERVAKRLALALEMNWEELVRL